MNNQPHEQHMYMKRNNDNTLIKAFLKFFNVWSNFFG